MTRLSVNSHAFLQSRLLQSTPSLKNQLAESLPLRSKVGTGAGNKTRLFVLYLVTYLVT